MKGKFEENIKEYFKKEELVEPTGLTEDIMNKIEQKQKVRYIQFKPAFAVLLIIIAALSFMLYTNDFKKSPKTVSVTFKFNAPFAKTVSLAGDFNDWQPDKIRLQRKNGEWYIKIKLPPGRYQYNYVINGKEWVPDPDASFSVNNGFGRRNSIIDLTKI